MLWFSRVRCLATLIALVGGLTATACAPAPSQPSTTPIATAVDAHHGFGGNLERRALPATVWA